MKNSHKTPSHNNPIKQKSKSRSSSREPSSSRSKSSLRKRVSFDDTPVEISRETSLSKISSNHSNNELVPNGIHLNHHHHQVLAKLHRNSRNFFCHSVSVTSIKLYPIVAMLHIFRKKNIRRVDKDLYYVYVKCIAKLTMYFISSNVGAIFFFLKRFFFFCILDFPQSPQIPWRWWRDWRRSIARIARGRSFFNIWKFESTRFN